MWVRGSGGSFIPSSDSRIPYYAFAILESSVTGMGERERSLKKNEARKSQKPRGHFWEERGRDERMDLPDSVLALIRADLILIVSRIKI